MSSEQGPISVKERIARFQNIGTTTNTTSNNAPSYKPIPTQKNNPPPQTVIQKSVNQSPPTTESKKMQGQVECPKVVTPSTAKNFSPSNTFNNQNNPTSSPTKVSPVKKVEHPWKKTESIQSQIVVKQSSSESVDTATILPVTALKALLEGKNVQINQKPEYKAPSKPIVPLQPDSTQSTGERETPTIQTSIARVSVKENAQKINQFYQAQKQAQKIKQEQQQANKQKQFELENKEETEQITNEIQGTNEKIQIKNTETTSENKGASSSSEVVQPALSVSPAEQSQETQPTQPTQMTVSGTKEQEQSLVQRLKNKKKMERKRFDDSD